jgi:hypothetical protein
MVTLGDEASLRTGDAVVYESGSGSALGGLQDGNTYYVIVVDGSKVELAASRQDALAGKAIKLTGTGNDSQKLLDRTHSLRAEALSGASGGDVGVAGSVAISIANIDTRAVVGLDENAKKFPTSTPVSVQLTGGDVDVRAQTVTESSVKAAPSGVSGGASGKSVGVGASFALNVSLVDTIAEIEDGETLKGSTGHFLVSADTANAVVTTAENGASGKGTSVGAAIGIAVVENKTLAHVGSDSGSGGTITVTGDLASKASLDSMVLTTGSGTAAGKSAAVGAAIALNIVVNDTTSEFERSFTGAQAVDVTASTVQVVQALSKASATGASSKEKDGKTDSKNSDQETDSQSKYATNRSGTTTRPSAEAQKDTSKTADDSSKKESNQQASSKDGPTVAASIAVNYLDSDTTARITKDVQITATGDLAVRSTMSSDVVAQGLSTATNTDSETGVAAAVSLNIALIDSTAEVQDSVKLQADSIAVESITAAGQTNTFQSRALAGAASSKTAIGGSVSINYIDQASTAKVGDKATLTSTAGNITVAADSRNELQNIAGGAALSTKSGGTGLGIAFAVNIVNGQDTIASVGSQTKLDASGSVAVKASSSLVPKSENLPIIGTVGVTSFAAGIAAANSGNAIGGSSSVNVFFIKTDASVGQDAILTGGTDVTVSAGDTLTVFSAAGGLAASTGNAGVGIGLDVGVIQRNTKATVAAGADLTATTGNVSVLATSKDDITSIAGTFGLSTSGTGVAASIAVQVLSTNTEAVVKDGASTVITAGGNVAVEAKGDIKTLMVGGAIGGGSSAGVGVANTTLVHLDTVRARVGEANVVKASGSAGISVQATSTEDIISITAAGAAASSIGVAVAPTILVLSETTDATVGRGATVNAQGPATGNLVVKASDQTTIISVAGSIGAAGSVGVAVGADVLSLDKDTIASVDSGVIALVDGDIDVSASSDEDITSVAAGIAVGGSAGVGVNASVHVLNLTTRAFIGDDPFDATASAGGGNVHAGGTVRIAADDRTEMDKVVATVAVGGSAGVGAAATVSVVTKKTEAFIGAGASVTGDGKGAGLGSATGAFAVNFVADPAAVEVTFDATGVNTTTNEVSGVSAGLVTGDAVTYRKGAADSNQVVGGLENGKRYYVHVDGTGKTSFYRTKDDALANDTAKRVDLTSQGAGIGHTLEKSDILDSRDARNQSSASLKSGGEVETPNVAPVDTNGSDKAGGKNTIPGQRNLTPNTVTVHGVAVSATSRDDIETYSAGIGGGTVGVAVAAAVNVMDIDTKAYVGAGASINSHTADAASGQSVAVGAGADFHHVALAAGAGFGAVGVAPGVDVTVLSMDTQAFVGDDAVVHAADDVRVDAHASEDILLIGMGIAAGNVGVGGGVSVLTIDNHTAAVLGGTVTAGGDVAVRSSDDTDVTMISGALGAGFVGVGASVGVTVIGKRTDAAIADGAVVNALGKGVGPTGGVYDGSLAGGDVASGFSSTDRNGVVVQASSSEELLHIAVAAGFGFVGVSGAVTVSVLDSDTHAWIGDADVNQGRRVNFNPSAANVSVVAETIDLGSSTGLVDGDTVMYLKGASGNTAVSGLADGATYYVRDTGAGKFALYNTKAHAIAGGATGRVNITGVGSGTGHAFANTKAGETQDVYVNAANMARVTTFAGAAAGGFVGVGGAVDVGVLNNDVSAEIRTGANVMTFRDVEVNALGIKEVDGFVVSAAGGFVGVAGAVSVWSVGTPLSQNYSDNNEDGATKTTANSLDRARMVFDGDDVNAGTDRVQPSDTRDIRTGEKVTYRKGATGNTAIGGLTDGATYYVRIIDLDGDADTKLDREIELYDTKAHAVAGGSTGRVAITGNGSGSDHSFNQTVDQDAAQQGEGASGMVGGKLSGAFGPTPSDSKANNSSGGRLAGIVNSGAGSLTTAAPSADGVAAALAASPPLTGGTSSTISSNSQTRAGGGISVVAVEDLELDIVAGGVGGGVVGAGAGISVVTIASNVSATAGGTLSAGGTLRVLSDLDEDVGVLAIAGAIGFVGLGASVAVVNDVSTSSAGISAGATVIRAGAIDVDAVTDQKFTLDTPTITIAGAAAIGASFAKLTVNNSSPDVKETWAYVGKDAQIGQGGGTVGDISVNAASTVVTDVSAFGVAVGAIAGSINFSFVDVTPTIVAEVGAGADLKSAGNITVDADADMTAKATTTGFSGGAGALAGSFTFATLAPVVTASIGSGAVLNTTSSAGQVRVRARHNAGGGDGAVAKALAGSGGALIGISGAVAVAKSNATVASTNSGTIVGPSSTVTVAAESKAKSDAWSGGGGVGTIGIGLSVSKAHTGGAVSAASNGAVSAKGLVVTADGTRGARAESFSLAGGLIAVGYNTAKADLDGTVSATLGSASTTSTTGGVLLTANAKNTGRAIGHGVTVGGVAIGGMQVSTELGAGVDEVVAALNPAARIDGAEFVVISAISNDDLRSEGESAGGGLIKVTGTEVRNNSDQGTQVSLGANSVINAGSVTMTSSNSQAMDTKADALSIGLASGGGGVTSNTATGDALINIGSNAQVTAVNIVAQAVNAFDKEIYDYSLTSASAAVGSADLMFSTTNVGVGGDRFEARIDVGSGAALKSTGNNANPGVLRLEALTDVNAIDNVDVDGYSLLGSFTLGTSEIYVKSDAKVNLTNASVISNAGNVDITTRSNAYARTNANVTIASLVSGVAGGVAVTKIDAANRIDATDSVIRGRDVNLFAGRDASGQVDLINGYANVDVQAYSLLPNISVPSSTVVIGETNHIQLDGSTKIQALQNATIRAIGGIGGDARGSESGQVLSLSLIPYGVTVDDNPTVNGTNTIVIASTAKVEAGIANQSVVRLLPRFIGGLEQLPAAKLGTVILADEKTALGLSQDIEYVYGRLNLDAIPFNLSTGTVVQVVAGANAGGTANHYYRWKAVSSFTVPVVLENENYSDTTRWEALGATAPVDPVNVTAYRSDVTLGLRTALLDKFYVIKPKDMDAPSFVYKNLGNVLLEQRDKVLGWIASHGSNAEAVARYQVQLELIDDALSDLGLLSTVNGARLVKRELDIIFVELPEHLCVAGSVFLEADAQPTMSMRRQCAGPCRRQDRHPEQRTPFTMTVNDAVINGQAVSHHHQRPVHGARRPATCTSTTTS